jgi:hypothetical protein
MKLNELRILIQEIIAEETSLDEIFITLPGLDNEKATQSYRDTEDAYKSGYFNGYNYAINIHNTSTNEGFFGPSKKDYIADFEAELEALIKDKKLENAPDLEKMKEKVRAIAKTSGFKGGKLGYQAAGTNKRTGNKIPPQFYYSTDSTLTGR